MAAAHVAVAAMSVWGWEVDSQAAVWRAELGSLIAFVSVVRTGSR